MHSARYPDVALLFPEQHPAAAEVLGRAFVDDPLIRAIIGDVIDVAERARRMALLFNVILAEQSHTGQPVIGALYDNRVAAAAIIEQVERPSSSAATVLRGLTLMPRLLRAGGFGGVARSVSTLDLLLKHRPLEPHIYLNVLGVEPELQRRHFGVALLDYLRAQAALRPDLAGVYLETATEANVAYYSHVGYRIIGEIRPLGVRVWRMLQPRSI
ncbi:MAG TPA: GNAT family N-acetyltransferase [Candidatus Binataceae bacterium]|jgi:ribosomal protein S18 acetylase RimI-like enzyme|nr:GNAT family N-acetyltransferase [Candidatus Binataceae bacterium]